MIVLGYNGFDSAAEVFAKHFGRSGIDRNRVLGHDASAAIFREGRLIAAAEEERFIRRKRTSRFPQCAIEYCLREAGIGIGEVDLIAFPWDFSEEWMNAVCGEVRSDGRGAEDQERRCADLRRLHGELCGHKRVKEECSRRLGAAAAARLRFVPHHLAHLMCGYYLGGCRESAFLISDGRSERYSALMGEISADGFRVFNEGTIGIGSSLGLLYSKFTRYLGFMPNQDEYKIMALSALCEPAFRPDMDAFVELLAEGRYRVTIGHDLRNDLGYYELFDRCLRGRTKAQIARLAQALVERVTRHQLAHLRQRSAMSNLLLEGGVALNCVNNSRISEESGFARTDVGFAANDSGVSIGAAACCIFESGRIDARVVTPYLGPAYAQDEIVRALRGAAERVSCEELDEERLCAETARHLDEHRVVAWFQGRMEYGCRALGNRSILASPARAEMQDIINAKVKHREEFRPFAAVILEAEAERYFLMAGKAASPYMTFVFKARPEMRGRIPAALHCDGTSRIQTVTPQQNPRLARLLTQFQKRSGLPCLINTSFNVQGEPIVCSPDDALRCFLATKIDMLVLGDFMVSKRAAVRRRWPAQASGEKYDKSTQRAFLHL